MQKLNNNAILLRQEGGEGGAGVPPIVYDFDIEKVKASGLFIPKDEFEKTEMTWKNNVKKAEDNGYKKLGDVLDNVSKEISLLTGIERAEIEKEGKKEREQLNDYVKRVLSQKTAEPLEKEKQLRDMFTKKETTFVNEITNLKQESDFLRYSIELQGATTNILTGIQDEKELEKSQKILNSILATDYAKKEYSIEYKRFVYKDNEGNIIYKNGEPKTTKEILAEVADIYLPKNTQQPRGLTIAKTSNNSQQVFTTADIHENLTKQGLTVGSREYTEAYSKMVRESIKK